MNLKQIATTIALLGSGALVLTGCDKDKAGSEVPGGAGGEAGEASCAADDHPAEGHCGGDNPAADEAVGDADDAAAGSEEPAAEEGSEEAE